MVDPEEPEGLAWRWTAVYALNLALPLALGIMVVRERGLLGLIVAVFVCWVVGVAGCFHLTRATRAVTDGGIFVAMFQFLPLGHFAAGMVAFLAWRIVTGSPPPFHTPGWQAEVAGFGITVLTALPLLLGAWILGGGPRQLFAPPVARTGDEADYIEAGPPAGTTDPAEPLGPPPGP